MPTVNPNNEYVDYLFTVEEARAAKIFTPLHLCMLQHIRFQYLQRKNAVLAPENPNDDRAFFLNRAAIEGAIEAINLLIDNHFQALKEPVIESGIGSGDGTGNSPESEILAAKASRLVGG